MVCNYSRFFFSLSLKILSLTSPEIGYKVEEINNP